MAGGEKKDDEPIRVTDRRASSEASAPQTTTPEPAASDAARTAYAQTDEKARVAAEQYPPIDFNTFVLSMSTSALVHLGEDLLGEGNAEVNLPLARQTIDLLGILEHKTKGNLTGEEERLLSQVLYDLRLRYVTITKKR